MLTQKQIDIYHITRRLPVLAVCALWLSVPQARAERLTLSAGDIRESWIYPGGAIQLDASGPLRPAFIEKNINPFATATVSAAAFRTVCSARAGIFASVNTKPSIVAISGATLTSPQAARLRWGGATI